MDAIDFSRITTVLSSPLGWLDLALTLASITVAYGLAWRWYIKRQEKGQALPERTLSGGMLRVMFPLLALLLVLLTRSVFRIYETSFFLDIALPLMLALAAIRILVYTLHTMFSQAAWLKASERAIASAIWFLVALYFLGILPELVKELESVVLPFGGGVSLWALIKGAVALVLTLSAALWIAGMIERRLLPKTSTYDASYNGRLLLARFLRALLVVVALLLVLQSIGIDLTVFAVLGGAVGVGIGLGLQRLAANYIAGFTVLFERAIKIGDMITVDGRFGIVREVTARYVIIRSLDGIDAIVPNEALLTQTVLNHSSNQREARATLPVQVAYGTDLRLALRLMEQAAMAESRVADGQRSPTATVIDFDDSGINLLLAFWVRDPENGQGTLRSNINLRLWDLFSQHGIEIPFPQQEVRLLNAKDEPTPPNQNGFG
ncbi:MAG: mechanosensitive ion channel [Burkholderiales bacterium]|jgi:small-conductance mechanosensitive channel|nr:mechanosensitive ion channel [Burkholderiales bacterium]